MMYRVLPVVAVLLLSACSGAGRTTDAPEPLPTPAEPEPVVMADYETFDPSAYPDAPPTRSVDIEHDVPPSLMSGTASQGIVRTVDGYRIQIANSRDRESADQEVADAIAWWRSLKEEGRAEALFAGDRPPVYTVYRQPYYRVRVGNFVSREEAEAFIAEMLDVFGTAVVVPDLVTIVQ